MKVSEKERAEASRGRPRLAALLYAGSALAGMGALLIALNTAEVFSFYSKPSLVTTTSVRATAPTTTIPDTAEVHTRAIEDPRRIVIPSIGVNAELVRVGLKKDGDMEVPGFGSAAWFEMGPAPGAAGPAVIIAHVDTRSGPDVFYRLDEVRPGDRFAVLDGQGGLAVFEVDYRETVLKSELPTERIWTPSTDPLIRLVTCGGRYDRSARHYLSNLIVYGHLVR